MGSASDIKKFQTIANGDILAWLSEALGRPVTQDKDPEDYNFTYFSELMFTSRLTMAGVRDLGNGDLIHLYHKFRLAVAKTEFEESPTPEKEEWVKHCQAILDDYIGTVQGVNTNYFSVANSEELMAPYFLRSQKSDNLTSLLGDLDKTIINFMKPEEWKILKSALLKSEERIVKKTFRFIEPMKPINPAEMKTLTPEEMKEQGFVNENVKLNYETRKDGIDLLALKELVHICRGVPMSPHSIALGAFAKSMPELLKAGFDGVVLKFNKTTKMLESIKLGKLPRRGIISKRPNYGGLGFSPVDASAVLQFSSLIESGTPDLAKLDESSYQVLVLGEIAYSKTKVFAHEIPYSKNELQMEAGEVFLFEKKEEVLCSRLFFYPSNYSELNIRYGHGSAIHGSNNTSFHSASQTPEIDDDEIVNLYKDFWREEGMGGHGSVIASRLFDDKLMKGVSEDIFRGQYEKILIPHIHSIHEVNPFTGFYHLSQAKFFSNLYEGENLEGLMLLAKNYLPLNRRFNPSSFLIDGCGLEKKAQVNLFEKVASEYRAKLGVDLMAALYEAKKAG